MIATENTTQNQQYFKASTSKNFFEESYITPKNQNYFSDIKIRLQEIIDSLTQSSEMTINEQINDKFLNLDFGAEFEIDAQKIALNDAVFFVGLVENQNQITYFAQDDSISLNLNDKKLQATNGLLNMLKTSIDSSKPIRLDFENDVTVILKLDKEGKIQAHFIPGTSEVENYLKNNITSLKQAFDEEEIAYSYLGYSKQNKENSKKEKRSKNNER